MPTIVLQHLIPWTLAAVCVGVTANAAAAGVTRGCAARDLQVLMALEERESAGTVPVEKLNVAILTMMQARIVCHEGRVSDALAIYDAVAESIEPMRSGRAQEGR